MAAIVMLPGPRTASDLRPDHPLDGRLIPEAAPEVAIRSDQDLIGLSIGFRITCDHDCCGWMYIFHVILSDN